MIERETDRLTGIDSQGEMDQVPKLLHKVFNKKYSEYMLSTRKVSADAHVNPHHKLWDYLCMDKKESMRRNK